MIEGDVKPSYSVCVCIDHNYIYVYLLKFPKISVKQRSSTLTENLATGRADVALYSGII